MDSKIRDKGAKGPASVLERQWSCCWCGDSDQPSFIKSCPICGYKRCDGCPSFFVESVEEPLFGGPVGHEPPTNVERDTSARVTTVSSTSLHVNKMNRASSSVHKAEVQRKRDRRAQLASKPSTPSKSFACHFYKRSPHLYNPWSGGAEFLKCLYPNPSALRHYL